eukprot:m.115291 g.115291  ORF g.115291 m.115291 type:complete len:1388 (-) comp13086_c0_seq2:452-4615(-)
MAMAWRVWPALLLQSTCLVLATPSELFLLSSADGQDEANTWTTREMLGGAPDGVFGVGVASFSYPVPQTSNNYNHSAGHETILELGTVRGLYVYGGFRITVANARSNRGIISSTFNILKKAPGGAEPSWYVWSPRGNPGPRALHSMTWLTLGYPDDEQWSLANPYAQLPCNLSANSTPCVAKTEYEAYQSMRIAIESARIVLFGGVTTSSTADSPGSSIEYEVLNATHIFDFNQSAWRPSASVIAPPPRWGHSACRRSLSTMLVFGGFSAFTPADYVSAMSISTLTGEAMDDTWLFDIARDRWVGPLALLPPMAAHDCRFCSRATTPSLGRFMASSVRVGTMWYVYGGASTSTGGVGAAGADNVDVLWSLDVAAIDPATGNATAGWRYYRYGGQPAVVFTLTGSVLDVLASNWSSLSGVAGGALFPADYNGTAASKTSVLVSCGGYLPNNGGSFIDRPFMCFGLNLINQSFETVPPAVLSQNWNLNPTTLSGSDIVLAFRMVGGQQCGGGGVSFGPGNCSVVGVVDDVSVVLFGGFREFASINTVAQFFVGESLVGRGVMTTTATEPTPNLKVSLYAALSVVDFNGSMILWYLSTNSDGCGLSSCAPSLWHLAPQDFYANESLLSGEASRSAPLWIDSGPDTTSNYALPSPVVNGIPFFSPKPGHSDRFVLVFAGSTAVELWEYTLVSRPCDNVSLVESLFELFDEYNGLVANRTAQFCTPVPKFLPGYFIEVAQIVNYADVAPAVSLFLKPVYAVIPDPVDSSHYCVVMVGQLNERWLIPPLNYSGQYVTAAELAEVRQISAVYSTRTRRLYWVNDIVAPSLRAFGSLVVLPDGAGANNIVYLGGVRPRLNSAETTLNLPHDFVWKASVNAVGGAYTLSWTELSVIGELPPSGVWGAQCVVAPMAYFFTDISFTFEQNVLVRHPVFNTGIRRARLVGPDSFEWEAPTQLPVVSEVGGTTAFRGWVDYGNMFGYPVADGASVLIGMLGGIVGGGEQVSAASLPTTLLTCREGTTSSNFSQEFCVQCPPGTFKTQPGTVPCTECPTGTYSPTPGGTSDHDCSACVPHYCGSRGTCKLSGFSPQCTCKWGYSGSQCQVNGGLVTLYIALACVVLTIAGRATYRWISRPRKSFHVFISYRVASDAALARRVCRALQGLEVEPRLTLNCYLDQKDIESGTDWEASFMTGLARSCVYLPLVSNSAIAPIEGVSVFDDKEDNLLKEIECALKLSSKGQIGVLPLLVGELDESGAYQRFTRFDVDRFPKGCSKTDRSKPVRETMRSLFKFQGIFTRPDGVDNDIGSQILDFLQTKVWRKSHSGVSLGLRRFWVGDQLAEERSHATLQRIGTMAQRTRPRSHERLRQERKHMTANDLWDTALTAALMDDPTDTQV